jgi:predicted phosphodiesterase
MPKIALLSDIHANLPALEAVLREVTSSGAEAIAFLGDIVGYGAHPAECVQWVRKLSGQIVIGNHDAALRVFGETGYEPPQTNWRRNDYACGLMHAVKTLSQEDTDWLLAQPYWFGIPGAIVAHASLDDPNLFNYIEDQETANPSLELLAQFPHPVGFFGHTHIQRVFSRNPDAVEWLGKDKFYIDADEPCAVTVGSVGQPREEDNRKASWALWDPEHRIVEFRRTDYDRLKAARAIVDAGLPLDAAIRLLEPEEMIVFLRECAGNAND